MAREEAVDKQNYINGEIILLSPLNPESGEPYFTIKSTGFSGPWKNGEVVKMPPPRVK